MLVRVAAFFGSEVVLGSLHVGWLLAGVAAFLGSEVVLTPFDSLFGSLHVRCEKIERQKKMIQTFQQSFDLHTHTCLAGVI